ncbi:hypothetical protein [Microbacter margulisiae]|uniref:Por secretion system C-terminal sorting domain-containing protein n=1 Tax=Microbacter margulisiae TaxID=1350067 RepID=A0A7W5DTB3_9PORP|nr:hypothetical protein [Microbacter margulisiae]MBB3187858.1 hypothetical protein [Microbacter margulisiae]
MKNSYASFFFPLFICMLLTVAGVKAQQTPVTVLYKHRNLPQAGDSLIKQQEAWIDPGAAGQNITWDFRTAKAVNDSYNVRYRALSTDTTRIGAIEHRTLYRYQVTGDSLWQTGYENATTEMTYTRPELAMRYPFRYGDTISFHFTGTGEYCHRIPLHVEGTTTVTADGTGTLYTPLGLQFKNALRIKSLRNYTQTGVDSVQMQLVTYSWYVWGNRYPIFETIETTSQKSGAAQTEHHVASFFFPPEEQAQSERDTTDWEQPNPAATPNPIDAVFTRCRLLPNPVETELRIEYTLTRDATISFSIHDQMGIAQIVTRPKQETAGQYTEVVQMGGLHMGIYPLYVTVDNMVKQLQVMKK